MMGWLMTLVVIAALAFIPIGIRGVFNDKGACVQLLAGPLKITLYPSSRENAKKKSSSNDKFASRKRQTGESGGKVTDFLPLLQIVLDLLGELRRKIRVSHLDMKLILGSNDPCALSINYGRAWAVLGNMMPLLDNIFVIKKRNLEVECDYTADETRILARVDVIITVGRFLCLAVRYGIRAVLEYFKIINNRKGGAVT